MADRIRRWLWLLLRRAALALALLLAMAGSALLTMRVALSMHEVEVPAVIGKGPDDAAAVLAARGLTLRVVGRRHRVSHSRRRSPESLAPSP